MIDLSRVPNIIRSTSASDIDIQEVEDLMKTKLPNVYKKLLRHSNGFSISGGLVIYGTEDLVERNETWEVDEYASGYVSIGDDGGGNVFLMLKVEGEEAVLIVDSGDMDPNNAVVITTDFSEWVNRGCLSEKEEMRTAESSQTCNVILMKTPDGGLKDLVKIKSVLGIDISTADLLKASKNLPAILVKRYPNGKAKKLIEKLGSTGKVLNLVSEDIND